MSVQLTSQHAGKVLTINASDKLTGEDYDHFLPEAERLIEQHGKLRVLFDMRDFHGWELSALWKDIKFDMKHFSDFERLAMVGDSKWERWMATFCKPFTTAEIRYFDQSDAEAAREWIEEGFACHTEA